MFIQMSDRNWKDKVIGWRDEGLSLGQIMKKCHALGQLKVTLFSECGQFERITMHSGLKDSSSPHSHQDIRTCEAVHAIYCRQ